MADFDPSLLTYVANAGYDGAAQFDSLCAGIFTGASLSQARAEISSWEGYAPTPLISLAGLARQLNVAEVLYKDEAGRFGLDSFKSLGGAYAVYRILSERVAQAGGPKNPTVQELNDGTFAKETRGLTMACATDGNHGRSVAWGAMRMGCRCVVYVHAAVSEGRVTALKALGATVVRVPDNYDATVRQCTLDADSNGWSVVSDTAWEGYSTIPADVMNGYSLVPAEVVDELGDRPPSHVFVQAGVGGVAAAVLATFLHAWSGRRPRFTVVEPDLADCFLRSARAGEATAINVQQETVMAGLSCGEVSPVAWPILKRGAVDFVSLPDSMVAPAMHLLANSPYGDPSIVAGESAVAGLCALLAARESDDMSA
ncbi:MAG: diaminopropionate ammonia-lyase, partial [Chromatiales bacterium]|nr:diaminopropionate ammonia-lyase [Chromatiales bacterium]